MQTASVRIENFDQASPLSIHHNKGVTSSMTPHSKHYNNMVIYIYNNTAC